MSMSVISGIGYVCQHATRPKLVRISIRKVAKDQTVWLIADISVRNRRFRPKKDSVAIDSYIYNLSISRPIMRYNIFTLIQYLK